MLWCKTGETFELLGMEGFNLKFFAHLHSRGPSAA